MSICMKTDGTHSLLLNMRSKSITHNVFVCASFLPQDSLGKLTCFCFISIRIKV